MTFRIVITTKIFAITNSATDKTVPVAPDSRAGSATRKPNWLPAQTGIKAQ
jgi:hypothetical protein